MPLPRAGQLRVYSSALLIDGVWAFPAPMNGTAAGMTFAFVCRRLKPRAAVSYRACKIGKSMRPMNDINELSTKSHGLL